MGFSKSFSYLILDYLSDRQQFVQVDDKKSVNRLVKFGVPQGSILGPVLFNLYVVKMKTAIKNSSSVQYADDTNLYMHTKVSKLQTCAAALQTDANGLNEWANDSNLLLNAKKTKTILFGTSAMVRRHNLSGEQAYEIMIDGKKLTRVDSQKILGVQFDSNLIWGDHVSEVTRSCYSTIKTLRHVRRFASLPLRKQLMEMLILSKMDYCNVVFDSITQQQLKRLERVQRCAAGFALGRYASNHEILLLGWLPIKEKIQFSLAKLVYKSLNCEGWPNYLPMTLRVEQHNVRRSNRFDAPTPSLLVDCNDSVGTFKNNAGTAFNDLPEKCRSSETFATFCKSAKGYLFDKATARFIA